MRSPATVIEFKPPFDLWETASTTVSGSIEPALPKLSNRNKWKLWFQTGGKETKAVVASGGEPLMPNFTWYQNTFNIKELTVPELFKVSGRITLKFHADMSRL